MRILCPHWPPLRCNSPHLGLHIPCIQCEVCNPAWSQMARPCSPSPSQSKAELGKLVSSLTPGNIEHGLDSSRLIVGIVLNILLTSVNQSCNTYKMATSYSQINHGVPQNMWKLWKVWKCSSLSRVWLSETPWIVAHQASLSMEFSGRNTGVGCHSPLQGIFPTQGSNLGLLHCRQILYHLNQPQIMYFSNHSEHEFHEGHFQM